MLKSAAFGTTPRVGKLITGNVIIQAASPSFKSKAMGHSAKRRHHLARMKRKALEVYPHMVTAKWANHLKGCSCHMCRNPRHSKLFSGDDLLTMQERRSIAACSDL